MAVLLVRQHREDVSVDDAGAYLDAFLHGFVRIVVKAGFAIVGQSTKCQLKERGACRDAIAVVIVHGAVRNLKPDRHITDI